MYRMLRLSPRAFVPSRKVALHGSKSKGMWERLFSSGDVGSTSQAEVAKSRGSNFLRSLILADLECKEAALADAAPADPYTVALRFPPEPNGFLHIGHAKSICLNFGLANEFRDRPGGATCFLRFDDTNPLSAHQKYVDSIMEDVDWLGFHWDGPPRFSSDYFDVLFRFAEELIASGDAYVCSLSAEEIRAYRGTPTSPGRECVHRRERSVEENLDLFHAMQAGDFPDGAHVLRARVDMASPNLHMRDPVLYRMRNPEQHPHFRTGDQWRVYPSYDYTHCLSDALEGITHSFCTLEFQDHRPIYNWLIQRFRASQAWSDYRRRLALPPPPQFQLQVNQASTPTDAVPTTLRDVLCLRSDWDTSYDGPQQTEFARLNLSHTITSKRKLKILVDSGRVDGWDDPRLPTIAGLRSRGVPPAAIRQFCQDIGVARADSGPVDIGMFDAAVRKHLDDTAPRAMAVLDPLKVKITNWPVPDSADASAGALTQHEDLVLPRHPKNSSMGKRTIPFGTELFIERKDFREDAHNKKFKRFSLQQPVRLRGGYVIHCHGVEKDENGDIHTLLCSYDPETLGQNPQGYKVPGVIHWVPAEQAVPADIHSYANLFKVADPLDSSAVNSSASCSEDFREPHTADELKEDADLGEVDSSTEFLEHFNPESRVVQTGCLVEPSVLTDVVEASKGLHFQFERVGYFAVHKDSDDEPAECSNIGVEQALSPLLCRRVTELRASKGASA